MRARTTGRRAAFLGALFITASQLMAGVAAAADDGTGDPGRKTLGWGVNGAGQIGDGTAQNRVRAVEVAGWPQARYSAAATGEGHSLGVGPGRTVQSWGANNCGQLGTGGTASRREPGTVPGLTDVYGVAAGRDFSLAWTGGGQVYAWGCNDKGQLGLGTTGGPVLTPTPVPALSGIIQVAAGYDHALALTWDGKVWGWGLNDDGEIGDGTNAVHAEPVRNDLTDVRSVSAGIHHSLAVTNDDRLFTWGRNVDGQLGLGTFSAQDRLTPTHVPFDKPVQNAVAGGHHSVLVTTEKMPYAFGQNDYGQLGVNDLDDRAVPTVAYRMKAVESIAAGADFTVALRLSADPTTRRAYAWGRTASYTRPYPYPVVNSSGYPVRAFGIAVGSSARHALAIQAVPPVIVG